MQLYRDGKRVLECLQRALRVADSCMETATSIELFVEILDRYVYYFDQHNESVRYYPRPLGKHSKPPPASPRPGAVAELLTIVPLQVTTKYLNGLIELIHSNLAGNQQDSASIENSKRHFYHTLEIIKSKEYEGVVLTPK